MRCSKQCSLRVDFRSYSTSTFLLDFSLGTDFHRVQLTLVLVLEMIHPDLVTLESLASAVCHLRSLKDDYFLKKVPDNYDVVYSRRYSFILIFV